MSRSEYRSLNGEVLSIYKGFRSSSNESGMKTAGSLIPTFCFRHFSPGSSCKGELYQ